MKLVIGIYFTLLGVLWTLDNLDVLDAEMYFHYSPAVLIVIGVAAFAAGIRNFDEATVA